MLTIWQYWEGPRCWHHIEVGLASVARTCRDRCAYKLLSDATLNYYLPQGTLHPNFRKLASPAQRADCIRAALLALHGGLWMDADTIGLACPDTLETDDDLSYCVWDKPPRRVLNGYCYARPGSELAKAWLARINEALGRLDPGRRKPMRWTALGEGVLTPLVDSGKYTARRLPRETFLPIDVDAEPKLLFCEHAWRGYVAPGTTVAFGLNHSWMIAHRRGEMRNRPEIMAASPLLVHRLITDAAAANAANHPV